MKRLSCFLILLMLAGCAENPSRKAKDSVLVAESGYSISGDFLTFYNSVPNSAELFGNPISERFVDEQTGLEVQYFQRARFDLVERHTVSVAPLGQMIYTPGAAKAGIPDEGSTCKTFDSGYSVCYAFLQYYEAHDGVKWFGDPISDVEVDGGTYVQYFENARMEWWPDRPSGERVVLSDLGTMYLNNIKNSSESAIEQSNSILVRVSALHALIGAGEEQTIYVIVQDPNYAPISNAQMSVTLLYPDESKEYHELAATNEYGVSQFTFPTINLPVESEVVVEATATWQGETGTGSTWFWIWW